MTRTTRVALGAFLLCTAATAASAQTPVQWSSPDGSSSVSFGVLAQGSIGVDTAANVDTTGDFCMRRLRFIAGGKIAKKLTFFVETDQPYLGYHGAADWAAPPTYLQDVIVTGDFRDEFKIDAGWLMVPVSYNSTQSAASLLAIGYSPYSFLASAPTRSRVGRDEGVQARGYVFKKRFEYRVGIFRGAEKQIDVAPRYAARVVWYPFGAQTGFFYAGTMNGQRKLVGVGASVDAEGTYRSHAFDAFGEFPLPNRDTLTLQADYVRYDGGTTFLQLPKQNTWMLEGGYRFGGTRFGVYTQIARQDVVAATAPDAAAVQSGVAYWLRGHRMNLKGGIGRTVKDRAASHTQFVGQAQIFVF